MIVSDDYGLKLNRWPNIGTGGKCLFVVYTLVGVKVMMMMMMMHLSFEYYQRIKDTIQLIVKLNLGRHGANWSMKSKLSLLSKRMKTLRKP